MGDGLRENAILLSREDEVISEEASWTILV